MNSLVILPAWRLRRRVEHPIGTTEDSSLGGCCTSQARPSCCGRRVVAKAVSAPATGGSFIGKAMDELKFAIIHSLEKKMGVQIASVRTLTNRAQIRCSSLSGPLQALALNETS